MFHQFCYILQIHILYFHPLYNNNTLILLHSYFLQSSIYQIKYYILMHFLFGFFLLFQILQK